MTVMMDFNRDVAEKMVAVAMAAPVSYTKKMSDEELVHKAFQFGCIYGFENLRINPE